MSPEGVQLATFTIKVMVAVVVLQAIWEAL